MKYELDCQEFWKENEKSFQPFSTDKPRVPLVFWLDDHFLLEEMVVPSTLKYYNDLQYRLEVNRQCNERLERKIGRQFFNEDPSEENKPSPNRFEVIMGARWELTEGGTPWLESSVQDIEDVKKLINHVSRMDMKTAAFPEDWQEKRIRYEKETGKQLRLGGSGSRGPATMATSILGTTNTCMFMMDEPDVMKEFFSILTHKLVEYHEVLMTETEHDTRKGYTITDDNCYLFPPALYEMYCAPVLDKLFREFAPEEKHVRYQHSDSSMGHLMGILRELGVNEVNLGPEIHPLDIRKAMPKALIHGQIPPFTLRNGTAEQIINVVRRDIEAIGQDGGLVECPAGSVAAGTPLENLVVYMWAVDKYGRYQGK
jgi:uroporphyrinogen decarboxylase